MCVCAGECVPPSRCVFSSTGGEKGSEILALKKEFRMLGTLRSDICVNPGEMWWNVSTAHALDACASVVCVCVWCGECVRVCMRRPSVFKACVLRGQGERRRRDSLLNHWRSTWLPLCLCLCVCVYQGLQGCSSSLICFLMTSDSGCWWSTTICDTDGTRWMTDGLTSIGS